jgi:hypothetical protein
VKANDFRRLALAMDGAIEGSHMAHPDFRVSGRIFATIHADNARAMVQLTPDQQQEFMRSHPSVFEPASGAWGRGGSTMVNLGAADLEIVGEAVTHAWQNAIKKGAAKKKARSKTARRLLPLALIATTLITAASAQTLDKELVATISGPAIERAIVSELLWDEGVLIIQSAVLQPDNTIVPRYFAAPAANMELRQLDAAPASAERYWKMKASRVSPTRLGTIDLHTDTQPQMFGVGSQQERLLDAVEFGTMNVRHDLRLGRLLIHSRRGPEPPYDGEVWGWSRPAINRIAYVDGKGDLWIARADGERAERILRGPVSLPAWSDDGRLIAVTERKDAGARWNISIVRVPERFRQ